MFETVKEYGERISSAEERITLLEDADQKHDERLKKLEDSTIRLENTVMAENRETRKTFTQQTEKLFTIVESAMGYQSNRSTQTHEFRMMKWNTLSAIFLKISGSLFALLGSGGILYVAFLKLFGQ